MVGDHHNRFGGNLVSTSQAHQFLAQIGCREHIEGTTWLIHKQPFRLDDQCARKADTLTHAARKFFGIGILKPIESNRLNGCECSFETLRFAQFLRFSSQFNML